MPDKSDVVYVVGFFPDIIGYEHKAYCLCRNYGLCQDQDQWKKVSLKSIVESSTDAQYPAMPHWAEDLIAEGHRHICFWTNYHE